MNYPGVQIPERNALMEGTVVSPLLMQVRRITEDAMTKTPPEVRGEVKSERLISLLNPIFNPIFNWREHDFLVSEGSSASCKGSKVFRMPC